jgi:hypothetical protein
LIEKISELSSLMDFVVVEKWYGVVRRRDAR